MHIYQKDNGEFASVSVTAWEFLVMRITTSGETTP
jgi:hypothetical protein